MSPLLLFLLVLPVTLHAHECIHDEVQARAMSDIYELPDPTPASNGRSFQIRAYGDGFQPLRFSIDDSRLDDGADAKTTYCASCSAGLTPARRTHLLTVVIPKAVAFLSSALRVERLPGKLTLGKTSCYEVTGIGAPYTTTGVDADYMIFLTARATQGSTIAWAAWCASLANGRPYAAHVNFGPSNIDTSASALDKQVAVAVHELSHALGFSGNAYSKFKDFDGNPRSNIVQKRTVNGVERDVLVLPTALSEAREHFGCATASFLELENSGGGGTAGSHWEKRVVGNEFMAGSISASAKFSSITLGLFEDSGWYLADHSVIKGDYTFGYNRGCKHMTGRCDTWDSDYFCSATGNGCSPDGMYAGLCGVVTYTSSLPAEYRYLADPAKGGGDQLMDYCPLWEPYSNGLCSDPANAGASDLSVYGERNDNTARCFPSDMLAQGYTNDPKLTGRCFRYQCLDLAGVPALDVTVGSDTKRCTTKGQELSGFTGMRSERVVNCPDPATACPAPPQSAPTCSTASSTSVTVEWDHGYNPTGRTMVYTLLRNNGGSSSTYTTVVYTGEARKTTVTGLTAGTSYKFRLRVETDPVGVSVLGAISAACGDGSGSGASPTPSSSTTPTPSATATPTPSGSATPIPDPTNTPSPSPSPSNSGCPAPSGSVCSGRGVCTSQGICDCSNTDLWSLDPATGSCDKATYSIADPDPTRKITFLVPAGQYVYFLSHWTPMGQDVVITATALSGDPDIFVSYSPSGQPIPTKDSRTWGSVARGTDELAVVWGDPSLVAGEYLIGVRAAGTENANVALTVEYRTTTAGHETVSCPYDGCSKRGDCVKNGTHAVCENCDDRFRGVGCQIDDTKTVDLLLTTAMLTREGEVVSGTASALEQAVFRVPLPIELTLVVEVPSGFEARATNERDGHPASDNTIWTSDPSTGSLSIGSADARFSIGAAYLAVRARSGGSQEQSFDVKIAIEGIDPEDASLLGICPADCSGHGTCVDGACNCDEGFQDEACATSDAELKGGKGGLSTTAMAAIGAGAAVVVIATIIAAVIAGKKKPETVSRERLRDAEWGGATAGGASPSSGQATFQHTAPAPPVPPRTGGALPPAPPRGPPIPPPKPAHLSQM